VVAGRDFSWQVGLPGGPTSWPTNWRYHGLRTELNNLPAAALEGSIQYRNASAAIAAIESLEAAYTLNEQTVSQALRTVRLAGRFQVVAGPVEWILDIAHNEPAARVFAEHVRERGERGVAGDRAGARADTGVGTAAGRNFAGRTFAVVGILADKDAREIAAALESLVDHWILCSLPGARGSSASELAQRLRLAADRVTLANSVEAGCEAARAAAVPGDRVIVFGSVYTVGPALQWLGVY
jgi:dihydrofolate synthase/folylpolyglutamate synthase